MYVDQVKMLVLVLKKNRDNFISLLKDSIDCHVCIRNHSIDEERKQSKKIVFFSSLLENFIDEINLLGFFFPLIFNLEIDH